MFDFLTKKFSSIFSSLTGRTTLTETAIAEVVKKVRDSLLASDVPYEVVEQFIGEVKTDIVGTKLDRSLNPGEQLIHVVHRRLQAFMGQQAVQTNLDIPSVVMVIGLQGAGKTTTIAKLCHYYQSLAAERNKKRSILVGSVDFYRPAAIEQLKQLANRVNVSFYRPQSKDPLTAAQELYGEYRKGQYDYLFLDTAGRLHVDTAMLHELKSILSCVSPKYTLLVLDAMTGQQSLQVAQAFDEAIGFTGAIMSKMDSDAAGGAAFAFRYALKKPIWFLGTGEKPEDLSPFYPDRIATRLLGLGDVHTLLEQAQKKIEKSEQDAAEKAFKRGRLTLDDFAQQLGMVHKMGSLSQIIQYIPGASGVSAQQLEQGEKEMKKFQAIIRSMTKKERIYPGVLDSSRKNRVAKGSGTTLEDVNLLLKRFEQSQQFVKLFKKSGRFKSPFTF